MHSLICLLLMGQVPGELTNHPTIVGMLNENTRVRVDVLRVEPHHLSATLTKAAQDHAWYMAESGEFEHYGGNTTPGVRAARYGYHGMVRENIARGHDSIPDVFKAWKDSPTHWDSIRSGFTEVGFGYAVAKDGTSYWVALYGNSLPSTARHVAKRLFVAKQNARRTNTNTSFMLIENTGDD